MKSKIFPPITMFSDVVPAIIGVLNFGLEEKGGAVAVHASSRGMRITLDGKTIAQGHSPQTLFEEFKSKQQAALKGRTR